MASCYLHIPGFTSPNILLVSILNKITTITLNVLFQQSIVYLQNNFCRCNHQVMGNMFWQFWQLMATTFQRGVNAVYSPQPVMQRSAVAWFLIVPSTIPIPDINFFIFERWEYEKSVLITYAHKRSCLHSLFPRPCDCYNTHTCADSFPLLFPYFLWYKKKKKKTFTNRERSQAFRVWSPRMFACISSRCKPQHNSSRKMLESWS